VNKSEFTELAYNNPCEATLALWGLVEKLSAEQDATQATVVELAAEVNAPAEA
jgi:hypothetical protein